MIEHLSLHSCTGSNLQRNFLLCKELQPDLSRQTTCWASLVPFQGMSSSLILNANMIPTEWWQSPSVKGPSLSSLHMTVSQSFFSLLNVSTQVGRGSYQPGNIGMKSLISCPKRQCSLKFCLGVRGIVT